MLNEEHFTFHMQYKHSGKFANRKYEELSYPKNQKMCDHSSNFIENATHPAAHPHKPLMRKYSPPPPVEERANRFQKHPLNGHRLARKPHRKEETHNSSKVSRFLSVNPYIRRLQKQSFFSYTNPYIYSTQQCRWSYFELGHGLPVG